MTTNFLDSAVTFRRGTAEKASFILLNQLDLSLTILAMSLGLTELNPLIMYLINMPVLLLLLKVAIPMLIAWIVPGRLLLPPIILLVLVTIWNIKELAVFLL